jgi:phosphorylcholine metabolism protein LicD
MRTKTDVQLQLLKEVDEICSKNNLHYVMIGLSSLNAHRNHTIKDGPRNTGIAMTQGDIDRFCEIIERDYSENRYIEGIFNNPRYIKYNFAYGDRNTADFHIINIDREKHHGINILIYPIRKSVDNLRYDLILKEQKLRKFLNKRVENDKYRYISAGMAVLNGLYTLTGGGKRYYHQFKKLTYIDKWEDIQNHKMVYVGNKNLSSRFFKDVEMHEVDGMSLPFAVDLDGYFTKLYGPAYNEKVINAKTQRVRDIVDTEFSYEEIMGETGDILKEARSIHEEMIMERKKLQNERDTFDNVWRLVKMTNDEIIYTKFFEENLDELKGYDMENPKEFEKLNDLLTPVLRSLKRYTKWGMTYSISPEADKLIEDVMIKNGDKQLVNEMKEISKKEYFVE